MCNPLDFVRTITLPFETRPFLLGKQSYEAAIKGEPRTFFTGNCKPAQHQFSRVSRTRNGRVKCLNDLQSVTNRYLQREKRKGATKKKMEQKKERKKEGKEATGQNFTCHD